MRLLFDTRILLAIVDEKIAVLPPPIHRFISDVEGEFHASVASLWEIAIKTRLGKPKLAFDIQLLPDLLGAVGIDLLPINQRHALAAVEPESPTRDPFDRMLLAQCHVEGLRLVTLDRALISHPLAAAAKR